MRTLRSTLHNIGPFGTFTLDVEGAEGTVVAVKAPNGSGKTCALEMAWLGACYRDTATQGSLLDRATDRDAFLESDVEAEDGQVYTIRHAVDPVARSSETVVVRKGETEPLWKGTKVSTFDKWAERALLPRDVLTSTVFAVQGANGFIGLGSAARISVILKAIGVARIERMAELARAGKKRSETELQTAGVRIGDARASLPDVGALLVRRDEIEGKIETLAGQVARKQAGLDAARAMASDSAIARVRYLEQVEARQSLEKQRDKLEAELGSVQATLDGCALEEAQQAAKDAFEASSKAAAELEQIHLLAADIEKQRQTEERLASDRARVSVDLERARARTIKTHTLVTNDQYVIDHAEELRAAVAKAEELRAEIQRLGLEDVRASADVSAHQSATIRHDADRIRHSEAATEAERRIVRAEKALENHEEIEAAGANLETAKETVENLSEYIRECEAELETLRTRQAKGSEFRIGQLRVGFRDVESSTELDDAKGYASEALSNDERTASEIEELPGQLEEAARELSDHQANHREAMDRVRSLEALAAQLPVIRAAEEELAAARSERNRAQSAATEAEELASASDERCKLAAKRLQSARAASGAAKAALVNLEPTLKRAAALATAEQRLVELAPQLETERTDEARLQSELAKLPQPQTVPEPPDVDRYRRDAEAAAGTARDRSEASVRMAATIEQLMPRVAQLGGELTTAISAIESAPAPTPPGEDTDLSALESDLQTCRDTYDESLRNFGATETAITSAGEQRKRIDALETEARALEAELADWTRLALDLGRDGIQSAEVDSAGPELTELTNDLLLTCHGPRYSVSIETQRTKANGKGATDECRVMVRDGQDNSEREARLHSGGECVVLGEAVSLALTMMACRRSGVRGATLVRDESGAALDPQNARVYLDMLRHAARVTNAGKVLFVSHSEDVQRMADSVLEIRGAA